MAVDANETRRQRVLDALANVSDRTWTRTVGANTFAFTIANPQLRILNGSRVLSVDVTVTRNGVTLYDDRINMPNPAVAIKAADGTVTDSPLQALRDTLFDVVNAVTRGGRAARLQRNLDGSFQGDTLAVRAATTDGSVASSNVTFATMAGGSSLTADTTANSVSLRWSWTGATYQGRMAFEEYDTSSLGAGATISAAVHTLYGNTTAETDSADNYDIDIRYKDWGGSVTTADWFDPRSGVWNGLPAGGILDNGSWDQVAGHANNFSDSGVYNSISTTGTTRVVIGFSGMNASTPANINECNFRTADATGTTSDPLLTITYTVAETGTIAATLQKATFSGTGAQTQTGTIAATLQKALFSGSGAQTQTGTIAATLQKATFSGSGTVTGGTEGTIAATMQAATFSGTGVMQPSGTMAATLQKATASLTGVMQPSGTMAATLQKATAALAGVQSFIGTLAGALQKLLFTGTGTYTAAPKDATYMLQIDLDRSGLFDADEDLVADVVTDGGGPLVSTERGHDLSRVLSPPIAGTASFILDNASGDYSYGGNLKGGREMRFLATYNSTQYDVWRGYIDHPVQTPPGGQIKRVTVQAFGNMARLAGRAVSTELYPTIKTGAAIEHLLDAANFAKNLQGYLDDLAPVGGWNLDSMSGDDPDTSGGGNDAVITLGSGVRGSSALDDSGIASTEFDGAATKYTVTDVAALRNIFTSGGFAMCLFNAASDGEGHQGTLIGKAGWRLYVSGQSGSDMKLSFFRDFDTTDGTWDTTNRVIAVDKDYIAGVSYNDGSNANDPTFLLYDIAAGTLTTLTVGSGITESSTPSGAAVTDSGSNLVIGNNSGSTLTFDGNIGTVRLYHSTDSAGTWATRLEIAGQRAIYAPRHIDTGETEMSWWWLDNEDALAALEALKNSEGPGCALYEDATGAIVFKGRYARNTESRSTTIQTTFNTGDEAEPRIGLPFEFTPGLKDVVNVCEIDAVTREAQASAEVWALGSTVSLGPDETRMFVANNSGGDPFTAAVTPSTGGGDYTVDSGAISTVSLDKTSGASVVISMTAGAAGASVSGLRLRAQLVTVTNSSRATNSIDTSASQDEFGVHTYRLPVRPEIGINIAQDFCNAIVGYFQDGRPTMTLTLMNNVASPRMVAGLSREISDRVRVIVGTELDQEMYIENVRHEVFAQTHHVTTFGLTQAQGLVAYFTLDDSVLDGDDVLAF